MNVIPFIPVGPVVVVLPHKNAQPQTVSGIVLADVHHDAETSGTIIAVGSAFLCASCAKGRETPYAVGDRVVFDRGAGLEIDGAPLGLPGETFLLLQEKELWAVLDEAALCEVV